MIKTVFDNKNKLILLLATILMTCSVRSFSAQECNGNTVTTEDDDFVISEIEPGFVIHSTTGLAWARCVVGQEWNNDDESCDGLPVRLTWQDALKLSYTYELEQRTDWRLPNIKELASIVERNCVAPSANLTIFPNTPDKNNFWSSSPNTAADKKNEAWSVSSSNGNLESKLKNEQGFYVRMVRYAEQH